MTDRAAILVLGAAVWPGGVPSPTLRRRTLHAAALWHRGEAEWVIPCGGIGRHPPSEAEAMRRLLREAGVPDAAIHPEDRSTTTHENLANARPILAALGASRAVLVTDATHAPRARLIAGGLGIKVRASCPSLRGADARPLARQVLREGPAMLVALWRLARRHRR